jgi:hypothetical protein
MDDQILPADQQETPPAQPPEPATEVAEQQAPPEPDRMDRLESAMSELTETVRLAAQQVAGQRQAAPPQSQEDFLNELAADPQGVISRVARQTFHESADETLNPAVMQVLDTGSKQLMAAHEARVDAEFGVGTFNEVFRPQLEKDVSQLRQANPRAMADPATMEALVNRLYGGDNFGMLLERRKAAEKEGRLGVGNHLMPSGGVPRLRGGGNAGDEIPADVETFIREVERSTGEQVDRKEYAKLYHTGVETGPGRHRTTVVDYLKAVGAEPDTLKMYGGERGSR